MKIAAFVLTVSFLLVSTTARADEEADFTSLFNGEDLDGWIGATDDYQAVDGVLMLPAGSGGKLFTEKTYGDFELRFEFNLTPGANNGLALRSPAEGDPAYLGMESQILDNTAEKYAKLKPYQYHGSIYGVAAAKRGLLKPVGQWNQQQVRCVGRRVTIYLNGELLLDVDLDEEAQIGPDGELLGKDGRPHPGLERESGHIGFLGHGDEIAFRNIRIKELDDATP